MLGSRVLVIDSDPQGNTTTGLGIDKGRLSHDIYHALMQETPLENVIVRTEIENLMLAPATINLAGADVELVAALSRETRLRQALAPVARHAPSGCGDPPLVPVTGPAPRRRVAVSSR